MIKLFVIGCIVLFVLIALFSSNVFEEYIKRKTKTEYRERTVYKEIPVEKVLIKEVEKVVFKDKEVPQVNIYSQKLRDFVEPTLDYVEYMRNKGYVDYIRKTAKERMLNTTPPQQVFIQVAKSLGIKLKYEVPVFNFNPTIRGHIADCVDITNGFIFEIDGHSHDNKQEHDKLRDKDLESVGYKVYHISNNDAKYHAKEKLEEIYKSWQK